MRISLVSLCLVTSAGCGSANAQPASVHVDSKSTNRTICHLTFARIANLVVDAKYVAAIKQRSRVDVERYTACPYDVEIKYGGVKMRVDFGSSVDLENVRNYDPARPVDIGFFVYDGVGWLGTDDVIVDADTKFQVQSNKQYELVAGTVHRRDPNTRTFNYCFALALVHADGYAAGGACAKRKSDLLPLNELFKKEPITFQK